MTTLLLGCEAGMRNRLEALMLLGKRPDKHHAGTYVDRQTPMDRIDRDFEEVKTRLADDQD